MEGNYRDKYDIGDQIRYDSVDNKVQPDGNSWQWKQYEVVAADSKNITLKSVLGEELVLDMNNNLYLGTRGLNIGKYKVGDLVRYNASTNRLKKGVIRTYDWQDYVVKKITKEQLILLNKNKEELILENTYDIRFNAGDPVKYDRLNNLLKKAR